MPELVVVVSELEPGELVLISAELIAGAVDVPLVCEVVMLSNLELEWL